MSHNVHVPIAALATIQHGARSFLHLPEVEVTSSAGATIELDLLAIADGRIVVGEARFADRLGAGMGEEMSWLRKFRAVAEALTADEVVFATAASEWRHDTRTRIHTVFAGSDIEVRLLERV